MSWQKWILAGMFTLSALVSVANIGKQREPTTPITAMIIVILNAASVALVVTA